MDIGDSAKAAARSALSFQTDLGLSDVRLLLRGNSGLRTEFGKQVTDAIVSLVEQESKLYLLSKVPAKSAADVGQAMVGKLWRYHGYFSTTTANNGAEFCAHALVAVS